MWKDEKLFCLLKKKNERIKNVVCINLLICSYYIIKIINKVNIRLKQEKKETSVE